MRGRARWFVLMAALGLQACSPAWNWREIRLDGAPLTIMLPCKPDHASQLVTLAGHTVPLSMTGCETGGATLAVSRMLLPAGASPGAALAQWRTATLAGMRAQAVSEQPFQPANQLPHALLLAVRHQTGKVRARALFTRVLFVQPFEEAFSLFLA